MYDESEPRLSARPLLATAGFHVDHVIATATSERSTAARAFDAHLLVLPYAGVFATHFARRDVPLTGATQALVVPANVEHRYSYPGRLGDRCLAISWKDVDGAAPVRPIHRLLTATELLAREQLRTLLRTGDPDPLAIGECIAGLRSSLLATPMHRHADFAAHRRAGARSRRAIERVQASIAADPTRRWTLDELSARAALSTHHLAQVFRREVGSSIYEYVMQARLGRALESVLASDEDLAAVALDAGFSSHSHFTARFRARFGTTPQALRRATTTARRHRIVTAGGSRAT